MKRREIRGLINQFKVSHAQQPLKPSSCMLKHYPDETRPLPSVLLSIWSSNPFVSKLVLLSEILSKTVSINAKPSASQTPSSQMKRSWPSPYQTSQRVGSIGIAWTVSLSLVRSHETNTNSWQGNIQRNQLNLSQTRADFPMSWPAWCAFNQVPEEGSLTE